MKNAIVGSLCGAFWLSLAGGAGAQIQPQQPRILIGPAVQPFVSTRTGPLGLTQISVAGGRVEISSAYGGRGGTSSSSSSSGSRTERTTVDLQGAFPKIAYELSAGDRKVVIQASDKNRFSLKRETKGKDSPVIPVEFTQFDGEPVTLSWGADDNRRTVRASGLWHLAVLEPEVCRLQLFPLLESIKPRWDLQATAEKTVDVLCREATLQHAPQRQRWGELIGQLGDGRYSRRQRAHEELLSAGQSARPFLEAIDKNPLDAEQRHRIRLILKLLAPESEGDSPEQIAIWLAGDPRVWFGLLGHADEDKRRLAAAQLGFLLERPIDFDAAADLDKRKSQIDAIRQLVERPALAVGQAPSKQ